MDQKLIAKASTVINAPASKVWQALTQPELIKQYLFGTEVVSDWKVGSPITYKGVWEGKAYEDKGTILEIEPEKHLLSTYWSSMSGQPDLPENYKHVDYALSPSDGGTLLTITQDGNASQASKEHSEKNWHMVLKGLKDLLEKQ
jgi:uncharacterized protein YndB with AHSA1/START domain